MTSHGGMAFLEVIMSEEKEVKVSKADQAAIDQAALIAAAVAAGLKQAGIAPQTTAASEAKIKKQRHVASIKLATATEKKQLEEVREQRKKMPISRKKARALKKPCKGCK